MSKEQTLTADEFFIEWYGAEPKDLLIEFTPHSIYGIMEQYAQAKVLEALEREFSEVVIFDSGELTKGTDYFKTEVKPNYE